MRKLFNFSFWLATVPMLYFACRIFVVDWFHIDSDSMSPTYSPGDRIYVNKLLFGARIYTGTGFSDPGGPRSFRMPGLRKIRPDDVVVFNYPYGNGNWEKIEFRMNNVFCKRVLGTPGDTVTVRDGKYYNLTKDCSVGNLSMQEKVMEMGEHYFLMRGAFYTIPLETQSWNVLSMGPLPVPSKGMKVHLDTFTRGLYLNAIEYEGGNPYGSDYEFRHDWYFVVGDNAPDSQDSRYFGFVPEKFIIGIVH